MQSRHFALIFGPFVLSASILSALGYRPMPIVVHSLLMEVTSILGVQYIPKIWHIQYSAT